MAWERQEPHRHAGSGAQEANGEGRDQGRDRGRPASPAGSPRARPEHAGYVHRVNPREAPTGCLRTNPRSEARAHLRKLRLQCSEPEPKRVLSEQKARLGVSPKQREARADQERPAALRGVRHVAGGWGKSTPSHQPGALGSFLGVKAKLLRGRCASLDPHPPDSAPPPLRGPLARFSSGGRVKGLVRPAPAAGARTRPLTRPERPKPAGRVSGALFPAPPALGERPRQGRRRRL